MVSRAMPRETHLAPSSREPRFREQRIIGNRGYRIESCRTLCTAGCAFARSASRTSTLTPGPLHVKEVLSLAAGEHLATLSPGIIIYEHTFLLFF